VIVQNPVETSAQPTAPNTTPTPPVHPSAKRTYTSNTYSAEFPSSWTLVSDNVDKGAYTETKMQSPDGGAAVLIDRSPGSALDPAVEAEGVRKDTAKTPGYQEVAFGYTTLGGRAAFEWIFDLPSGRRYDYFTNTNGGRFAVLGTGSDTSTSHKVARSVTSSLR
jgi:hypothetical protein